MRIKTNLFCFILFLVILIFSRVLFLFGSQIPLGYDSGLYKHYFEESNIEISKGFFYTNNYLDNVFLPNISLVSKIFHEIGFDSNQLIIFLPIFFEILIFLNLYLFVKKYFSQKVAIYSIGFYSLSIVGYFTYWFNYQKNLLGIGLMFFAFYLFDKKKYLLGILTSGFISGLHRPTFALFSNIFLFNWIDKKEKKLFFSGILIIFLGFLFYFNRIYLIEELIFKTSSSIGNSGSGTFLSIKNFIYYSLLFIPFILVGIYNFFKSNKYSKKQILTIWLVLSIFLISFKLFFYNRYLIYFNILLIIFAAYGFNYLETKVKISQFLKNLFKYFYLFVCLIFLFNVILQIGTLINENEMDALIWLDRNTDSSTYVAYNDKFYMTWIYGWNQGNVISHKDFEFNYIDFNKLFAGDFSQLNNSYLENNDIYLFIGRFGKVGRYDEINLTCLDKIYENEDALILNYSCQ